MRTGSNMLMSAYVFVLFCFFGLFGLNRSLLLPSLRLPFGGWWLVELLDCKCHAVLCAVGGWNGGLVVAYQCCHVLTSAYLLFCFVCLAWSI